MELLACSGPGAGAAISRSIQVSFLLAAGLAALIAVAVVVPVVLGRRWQAPIPLLALLLVHPAWTGSAFGGDCGPLKLAVSWIATVLGCALAVWHVARVVQPRPSYRGGLHAPTSRAVHSGSGVRREVEPVTITRAVTGVALGLSTAAAVGLGLPALDTLAPINPLVLLGLWAAVPGVAVWAEVAYRKPAEPRAAPDRRVE